MKNTITEGQWKYLRKYSLCFERSECIIERDGKGNNGTRHKQVDNRIEKANVEREV